jgi:aldose 1-epimerase
LQIAADEYLPIDEGSIPLGHAAPVSGTIRDFRAPRRIGEVDAAHEGIDHCMVLTGDQPAAVLTAPGAPTLRFFTDEPGLQVYTGKYLAGAHEPFTGICLEPQGFPDAVNQPGFPSVIVTPDAPYVQRLSIEVG